MNRLNLRVKVWIFAGFFIACIIPGNGMHYFAMDKNGGEKYRDFLETGLQRMDEPPRVKLNNMELVGVNQNDLKGKYSCSVTDGVPLPVEWARGGHAGGIIDGHVIVAGGTNWSKDKTTKYWLKNTVLYQNGQWMEGPGLPKPLAYSAFGCNDTGLYLAGGTGDGEIGSKEVYWLNALNKESKWKSLPDLPQAVIFGAGAILNNTFYVTCGSVKGQSISSMWCLDLNHIEKGWKECKAVPGAGRVLPALVACGEYLYLIGGLKGFSPLEPLNDLYRYTPEKDEWKQLTGLPLKGYAWVAQPVNEKHLLVTGRADGMVHDGIWILDPANSSMKKVGHLIIPSATAPLIKVNENHYWLVGGEPDSNKNRTEIVSVINVNT